MFLQWLEEALQDANFRQELERCFQTKDLEAIGALCTQWGHSPTGCETLVSLLLDPRSYDWLESESQKALRQKAVRQELCFHRHGAEVWRKVWAILPVLEGMNGRTFESSDQRGICAEAATFMAAQAAGFPPCFSSEEEDRFGDIDFWYGREVIVQVKGYLHGALASYQTGVPYRMPLRQQPLNAARDFRQLRKKIASFSGGRGVQVPTIVMIVVPPSAYDPILATPSPELVAVVKDALTMATQ